MSENQKIVNCSRTCVPIFLIYLLLTKIVSFELKEFSVFLPVDVQWYFFPFVMTENELES